MKIVVGYLLLMNIKMLREVEAMLSLWYSYEKLLSHYFNGGIVGEFEVVHASHHGGQEVVGIFVSFVSFPDNCKGWSQTTETWTKIKFN